MVKLLVASLGAAALMHSGAVTRIVALPASVAKPTIAVLTFDNNTGATDYDALGKGMSAMMITDLSSVDDIQVVERERMQDLLKEMEMQRTQYFDSTTAARAGKLVGAQYVVVGSMAAVRPSMRIDTRIVRVETGEIVKAAKVVGKEDKLFDLEQKLANELIDGLPVALSPEARAKATQRQNESRIDDLNVLVNFSNALALYDIGDYGGALERMVPVVRAAPNSYVVKMSYDAMKKRSQAKVADKAKDKLKGFLRKKPH
jgi:TolB-like protein